MKKVRISIEWNYGYSASIFKFLQMQWKIKLLANDQAVSKLYTVVTLLRNIHIGFYGGQTSNYFNLHLNGENFVQSYLTGSHYEA